MQVATDVNHLVCNKMFEPADRKETQAQGAKVRMQGAKVRVQGTQARTQGAKVRTQGAKVRVQGARDRRQGAKVRTQGAKDRTQGAKVRASISTSLWDPAYNSPLDSLRFSTPTPIHIISYTLL